ncbi:hypothetical protein NL676_029727 [Syzygium grande]|nr:hypothetical protein NL676_029727 [Syzygium grande]
MPPAPHLEELSLARAHPALINMIVGLNKLKSLVIGLLGPLECVLEECWKSLASSNLLRSGDVRVDFPLKRSRKEDHHHRSGNLIILDSHGGLHHSLRSVDLYSLPKLASLPRWLLQASNLERLSIWECDELDICKDESGNLIILDSHGGLHHSLRSVTLFDLPKLASLPRWLLQASNLEDLLIWGCEELDICKDAGGNLIILDSHGGLHHGLIPVKIIYLPKLASLPNWLLQQTISRIFLFWIISSQFLKQNKRTVDLVGNEKMKTNTNVRHIVIPCTSSDTSQVIPDITRCYGRSGKFMTLVASNVAARGLDINDVQLIIQDHSEIKSRSSPRPLENHVTLLLETGRPIYIPLSGECSKCKLRGGNNIAASPGERPVKRGKIWRWGWSRQLWW